MTVDWSNNQCLELIDLYEKQPVLWNTKHNYYFSKIKKQDAWDDIAKELNSDVNIVRRKMQSLLGSFRAQKSKGRKFVGSEKGLNEVYKSKWFAFEKMQFLFDKDEPQSSVSSENDFLNAVKDEFSAEEIKCNLSTDIDFEEQPNWADPYYKENEAANKKETGTRKRKTSSDDPKIDEALKLVENAHARCTALSNDRFATYGQHVANKLRLYSTRTQAIVEHMINNILFEADMGHYDNTSFVKNKPSHTQSFASSHDDSHRATSTPSPTA